VPDPSLPLTGGCGCGAVRFEISEPLGTALYCHCTRCQQRTGAAAGASAWLAPGSFTIIQGEEQLHAWAPGGGFEKIFCEVCGSGVFVRNPETGEGALVRLGVIEGDPGVRPSAHQFAAYAAPWQPIPDDGLPRYDERMPAPG
jgi:hypothetical protein